MIRRGWIDAADRVPLLRQCALAEVARSTVYAQRQPTEPSEQDVELCHAIDEIYTQWPFYGSRRMVVELGRHGFRVNRKRVQRLMRGMLEGARYMHEKRVVQLPSIIHDSHSS